MGTALGVDWASGCWVVAAISDDSEVAFSTEPSILNVWHEHETADAILVDMPIGLPDSAPRDCDEEAKELLGDRRSSIFTVPCSDAVYAHNYKTASEANGGSLGSQSWGLIPRIREVDVFLEECSASATVFESHPEVCYAKFAKQTDHDPPSSKHGESGIKERLAILESVDEVVGREVRAFVNERRNGKAEWHHRIQSGRVDDVLDAAVLALTARHGPNSFGVLPEERDVNDRQVIVYPA